jgi:hypothetical protein
LQLAIFPMHMGEKINERVSIVAVYNRVSGKVMPAKMQWQGREYHLTKLAYHHKARVGQILYHVFHVSDGTNDYKLLHNTDNLQWVLEEVVHGT